MNEATAAHGMAPSAVSPVQRAAAAALALGVALSVTSCVAEAPIAPTPSASPSVYAPSPAESDAQTGQGPTADDATLLPIPEANPGSQADAIAAADTVMRAFARPDLDPEAWMTGMYPLLSPTGADAYLRTDPDTIPARQVTGTGTVLEGSTEVALLVTIPTDAGPYTITLTRTDPASPWLAERIRPQQ